MELRENPEGWNLALHNARVQLIQVDFRLGLLIGDGSETAQVYIKTPFNFEFSIGERVQVFPDRAETVAPLLSLANQPVLSIRAGNDGSLSIEFDGKRKMQVAPGEQYEAWQSSCGGKLLVGGPEAKIACFQQ